MTCFCFLSFKVDVFVFPSYFALFIFCVEINQIVSWNCGWSRGSIRRMPIAECKHLVDWSVRIRCRNWRHPPGTTVLLFRRRGVHHRLPVHDEVKHGRNWQTIASYCDQSNRKWLTSQASLPSAPAQMDEGGRTKFGPNWVLNAAWHLASSHKGTSISFKMTEWVPSEMKPKKTEIHQSTEKWFKQCVTYPLIYGPIQWRRNACLPFQRLVPDVACRRRQCAVYVWPAGRNATKRYRWPTTNCWIADGPWRAKRPAPRRPAVRWWRWRRIHRDGLSKRSWCCC